VINAAHLQFFYLSKIEWSPASQLETMPLKRYDDWLQERVKAGLPTKVPTPDGVESYSQWYYRVRGLQLHGTEPWMYSSNLKNYGDWIAERGHLNLPLDTPPPPFIESYATWYKRVSGFELYTSSPEHVIRLPPGKDYQWYLESVGALSKTPPWLGAPEKDPAWQHKAVSRTGRYGCLWGLVSLPLTAAAAGLGYLGMTKAAAATGDAAAITGGLTPTNGSLAQRAFDAINEIMPRSAEDMMRVANNTWKKFNGERPPEETKAVAPPSVRTSL
jgi:hypothetical protein